MKSLKIAALIMALIGFCIIIGGCAPVANPPLEPASSVSNPEKDAIKPYRAIAYVTVPASKNWRWIGTDVDGSDPVSDIDTRYVTHINFAFGMIDAYNFQKDTPGEPLKDGLVASKEAYKDSDGKYHYKATVNGWIEEMGTVVDGGKYLKALVDLKKQKPDLKILLSIGGWNSDGFCYMAQTEQSRAEFIESCIMLINEYNLDGIDLDWEYPTNGGWGEIASCDDCTAHGRLLLTEFRASLTNTFPQSPKLLTIASGSSQPWIDEETIKVIDYMNVMCYDYDSGSGGDMAGLEQGKRFMNLHALLTGDTPENRSKINLGIPFYNEGGPYLVPYYKGWTGHVDASPEITAQKMNWVKENGYGGGFYWAYSMDTFEQDVKDPNDPEVKILQRTLYETLNGSLK